MARAGMDPAVASERLGHTDGGALFLQTYRHLYEAEKRTQALRLEALVRGQLGRVLDRGREREADSPLNEARKRRWARLGSNQRPLACEASALPLSYAPGRA